MSQLYVKIILVCPFLFKETTYCVSTFNNFYNIITSSRTRTCKFIEIKLIEKKALIKQLKGGGSAIIMIMNMYVGVT